MLTKRRELLVTVLHLRSPVAFKTPLVSGRNGIRCNPGAGRFTSRILCCERNSQTRRGELIFFRGLSPHQSQRLGSEFLFRHGSHFVHTLICQDLREHSLPFRGKVGVGWLPCEINVHSAKPLAHGPELPPNRFEPLLLFLG